MSLHTIFPSFLFIVYHELELSITVVTQVNNGSGIAVDKSVTSYHDSTAINFSSNDRFFG